MDDKKKIIYIYDEDGILMDVEVEKERDIYTDDVYICPVCGYTHEGEPPEKCPVCGISSDRFKKF